MTFQAGSGLPGSRQSTFEFMAVFSSACFFPAIHKGKERLKTNHGSMFYGTRIGRARTDVSPRNVRWLDCSDPAGMVNT